MRAHEHRQGSRPRPLSTRPGTSSLPARLHGRRAVNVRKNEDAVAGVELADALTRNRKEVERIVRRWSPTGVSKLRRNAFPSNVRDRLDQALRQRVVGD